MPPKDKSAAAKLARCVVFADSIKALDIKSLAQRSRLELLQQTVYDLINANTSTEIEREDFWAPYRQLTLALTNSTSVMLTTIRRAPRYNMEKRTRANLPGVQFLRRELALEEVSQSVRSQEIAGLITWLEGRLLEGMSLKSTNEEAEGSVEEEGIGENDDTADGAERSVEGEQTEGSYDLAREIPDDQGCWDPMIAGADQVVDDSDHGRRGEGSASYEYWD